MSRQIGDLTVEEVERELRALAAENPDFKYNPTEKEADACYYHRQANSDPKENDGCIFGQAFQRLGVTKETLALARYRTAINSLWLYTNESVPDSWGYVQRAQDSGGTWGEAIKFLDKQEDPQIE